ncbi:septum site-determining protein MinC [uncultured Deinococcus sp.]|uniref:septum site-determining protein MinC n=1 Tax=uncultured Deinococcus sp. TaxID=158789 RepID=UPI002583D4F5|nr:septum site-determining protein MinC [uncultured Deinococcus sp.]
MKLRGTLGGLNLLLEPGDTPESVAHALASRAEMLTTSVTLEIQGDTHPGALEAALDAVRAAGGTPGRVRAPRVTVAAPGLPLPELETAPEPQTPPDTQTVILPHSIRAGFRGEYGGSVVVLGDVNPGAELIAAGDVIVTGALRGVVHAGYGGREDAIVWARPIASAQLRIGDAVARAPEGSSNMRRMEGSERTERAYLQEGRIVIDVQR